jgi:3-methyladenine DNA glycosylase AlkD
MKMVISSEYLGSMRKYELQAHQVKVISMHLKEILKELESLRDSKAVAGMARAGINPESAYGISIPDLRRIAKSIGKNHKLALQLWESGIHEARILATMIDDPKQVTEVQIESWTCDFNSWDICDQCCNNLFRKTKFAHAKAVELSSRDEEFVKRTGFVLMACLSVHDKKADDGTFVSYLPIIKREASDERNFVKKAVNWALRQIGKRNITLNREAIKVGEEISGMDSKAAKWVASDALRELRSEAVQKRLNPTK